MKWLDEVKETKRHPMGKFTMGLGDMVHTHDEVRINAIDFDRLIEIAEKADRRGSTGERGIFKTLPAKHCCPVCGGAKEWYGEREPHRKTCPYSDEWVNP